MMCAVRARAVERSRGARGSLSTSPARPTLSFDPPAHAEGAARSGGAMYFHLERRPRQQGSAEPPTAVLELPSTDSSAVNGSEGLREPLEPSGTRWRRADRRGGLQGGTQARGDSQ